MVDPFQCLGSRAWRGAASCAASVPVSVVTDACYSAAGPDWVMILSVSTIRLGFRLLLLLPLLLTAPGAAFAQLQQFPTAALTIVSASGLHKFSIEIATTPAQMEHRRG